MDHAGAECLRYTVSVYLVRHGRVLLADHPRHELWLPIAGHMEPGEDLEDTLYRELTEESGYTPGEIALFGHKPTVGDPDWKQMPTPHSIGRFTAGGYEHLNFVYLARVRSEREPTLSPEHRELRWFTESDLDTLDKKTLLPRVRWHSLHAISYDEFP